MLPLTTTISEEAPRKPDVSAMIHISSIQLEDKREPYNQQEETHASSSSANSEQLPEKTDVSKVNRTYSVKPEPTTQPTPTKDKYQKRRAFKPRFVPLDVLTTPWWESATFPNMFQLLSSSDDESREVADDVDDDDSVSIHEYRTVLTGGGADGSDSDTREEKDDDDDDFTSVVYSNCDIKLKHSEAVEMLETPDISKVSKFPPFKPKGGTVYVITDGQRENN